MYFSFAHFIKIALLCREENTSGDGRAYLESWSCYNRCEMGHPGDTCSCLSSCYEQQTCCPDYEAYCLGKNILSKWAQTKLTSDVKTNSLVVLC